MLALLPRNQSSGSRESYSLILMLSHTDMAMHTNISLLLPYQTPAICRFLCVLNM